MPEPDAVTAFVDAMLAPMRDIGTMLAAEIDKLRAELEAEAAALRSELAAAYVLIHDRTDHLV